MITQPSSRTKLVTTDIENELDIRSLLCVLWKGKFWIIGMALGFSLLALTYTFLAKEEWSAMAITERPTVNMLGDFYFQQEFLDNFNIIKANLNIHNQPSVTEESYKEFIVQLGSWDTRRNFWLQTTYYKQRMVGNKKTDTVLLDELINNIRFVPKDGLRNVNESVKLTAETPKDANNLLREYIVFANKRAASHLIDGLKGAWIARHLQIKEQVKQQEEVAHAIFDRRIHNIEKALIVADKRNILHIKTDLQMNQLYQLPGFQMFLLGRSMLRAYLESLEAVGPDFNLDYDQNRAMLNALNISPTLNPCFQTYRYLRTPEEPIKRDSPHRTFLMMMWSIIGALIGAGVTLTRHRLY